MKKNHLKFISSALGIIILSLTTSSVVQAGKAGVVRLTDLSSQPTVSKRTTKRVTKKTPRRKKSILQTSFGQPVMSKWGSGQMVEESTCPECQNNSYDSCPTCNECSECKECRPRKVGLFNRVLYLFCGDSNKDGDDDDDYEYDENGKRVKKKHRKHIRCGRYTKVYSVDPWYNDPRNGQVYAAKGYGMPMTVPLAPNVEHEYNYGWGIPSSRLTPISKPPARNYGNPYPAIRYPVQSGFHNRNHRYRIETPMFQNGSRNSFHIK